MTVKNFSFFVLLFWATFAQAQNTGASPYVRSESKIVTTSMHIMEAPHNYSVKNKNKSVLDVDSVLTRTLLIEGESEDDEKDIMDYILDSEQSTNVVAEVMRTNILSTNQLSENTILKLVKVEVGKTNGITSLKFFFAVEEQKKKK